MTHRQCSNEAQEHRRRCCGFRELSQASRDQTTIAANGRIQVAGAGVEVKDESSNGNVATSGGVAKQGVYSAGCVLASRRVAIECLNTVGPHYGHRGVKRFYPGFAQDRARIVFNWQMRNDSATIKGEHK